MQTGSIDPLYHVCFGGMIFSYLVTLPVEHRHLEHQQHANLKDQEWPMSGSGEAVRRERERERVAHEIGQEGKLGFGTCCE
ncbi:hypothetical protein F8388_009785 [Cannabis sativa]|uniref:Uncharacterized protein n=1 Tax=Cannabis sativa TaxID=3483 RepID=A0A7J6EXN9_CANSA|nr:hypothetical protein G4B88_029643 [Cannabis sativa]KAF4389652.1 hypothetical protein F8388_009785 [Cannabis sativa]